MLKTKKKRKKSRINKIPKKSAEMSQRRKSKDSKLLFRDLQYKKKKKRKKPTVRVTQCFGTYPPSTEPMRRSSLSNGQHKK